MLAYLVVVAALLAFALCVFRTNNPFHVLYVRDINGHVSHDGKDISMHADPTYHVDENDPGF